MAYNVENSEKTIQTQLDVSENILIIPTTKLDADQYAAEDIDGVTESLFGSGNMAYGALQASQTNESMMNQSPFSYDSQGLFDSFSSGNQSGGNAADFTPNIKSAAQQGLRDNANGNGDLLSNTDRGIEGDTNFVAPGHEGNFSAGTVGSVSASQLSSDAGSFAPAVSGLSLGSGLDGLDGDMGNNGGDGLTSSPPNSGNDGQDGSNGQDGSGDGTTVIGVDIGDTVINLGDLNIDLGDLTEIIDGLFIDLGDTITILTTEINNTIDILGDTINNLDILDLTNVTILVTNITDNLTSIVNNTVTEISNITTNITNIVNNILDGDGLEGLNLLLDLNILDTVLTDVDVPLYDLLATDVNLNVDLDPVYNLASNIVDLTGLDVLSDALGELGGTVDALQNTIDQVTDLVTDLDLKDPGATVDQLVDTLGGLGDAVGGITDEIDDAVGGALDIVGLGGDDGGEEGLISQTVDPAVNDVGNVLDDVTGGATEGLTDNLDDAVDGVTDVADDLTGGLTGGLLGENNNNQDGNGDSDIVADLGIDPLNIDETVEAALDPVEDLIGDVDLGIGLDTDLLGGNGDEIDNNAGDTDLTVETGIDLVDNTLLDEGLDVPLDPVEQITGDIDLDVDLAADLLDDLADPLVNNGEGGTGEDTLVAGLGDALGDTVEGVLDGDLGDDPLGGITDNLGLGGDDNGDEGLISDTLDPVVNDAGDVLDDVTGGATQELTDGLDDAVDGVTDVADDLTGGLTDGLLGMNNDNQDGNGDSDIVADLGVDPLGIDEGVEAALDPVEDLAGDLDIDLGLATNLFDNSGSDNDAVDSDVTAAPDLELVDTELLGGNAEVELDIAEHIIGDTDINADAATDILGDIADPLINDAAGGTGEDTLLSEVGDGLEDVAESIIPGLNAGDDAQEDLALDSDIDILDENLADTDLGSVLDPVEEIAGDIDTGIDLGTDILGDNETDNHAGDTDLTANLDVDLGGEDVIDTPLDVPLDPVEEITGDLDLDIGGAIDLLNSDDSESTEGNSGSDDSNWTESTIGEGGLFDDLVDGLGGAGDVLPDPAGTVAEGLGAMDVEPEIDIGSLGGLFG